MTQTIARLNRWSRDVYAWSKSRMTSIATQAKEEKGQALVEYALILALIAVVVIVALTFLGKTASNTLNNIGQNIAGT